MVEFVDDRSEFFPEGESQQARDHQVDDIEHLPSLMIQARQGIGFAVAAALPGHALFAAGESQRGDARVDAVRSVGARARQAEQDPAGIDVRQFRQSPGDVSTQFLKPAREIEVRSRL